MLSLANLEPAVLALLQPILLEVYNQVLLPELQKLDGQVGSPELKIVADAMLAAIQAIVPAEIAKA
jgi:hypothetical protein